MRTLGLFLCLLLVEAGRAQSPYTNHPTNMLESNPLMIQEDEACFSLAALRTTPKGAHISSYFQNPYYQKGHKQLNFALAYSFPKSQLKFGLQHMQYFQYRKQWMGVGLSKMLNENLSIGSQLFIGNEKFPEQFNLGVQSIQLALVKQHKQNSLYAQFGFSRKQRLYSNMVFGCLRKWNNLLISDASIALDGYNSMTARFALKLILNSSLSGMIFFNSHGTIGLQISLSAREGRIIAQQFQHANLGSSSALGLSWKQDKAF